MARHIAWSAVLNGLYLVALGTVAAAAFGNGCDGVGQTEACAALLGLVAMPAFCVGMAPLSLVQFMLAWRGRRDWWTEFPATAFRFALMGTVWILIVGFALYMVLTTDAPSPEWVAGEPGANDMDVAAALLAAQGTVGAFGFPLLLGLLVEWDAANANRLGAVFVDDRRESARSRGR